MTGCHSEYRKLPSGLSLDCHTWFDGKVSYYLSTAACSWGMGVSYPISKEEYDALYPLSKEADE